MLREIIHVRQDTGEPERRWYESEYFDLIVWFDAKDRVVAFQLCYDKHKNQRALTWKEADIYFHDSVDDGEGGGGLSNRSPILVTDGVFEKDRIAFRFKKESQHLNKEMVNFIYRKLLEYKSS